MKSTITSAELTAIIEQHYLIEHKLVVHIIIPPPELEVEIIAGNGGNKKAKKAKRVVENRGLIDFLRSIHTTLPVAALHDKVVKKFPAMRKKTVQKFYAYLHNYVHQGYLPHVKLDKNGPDAQFRFDKSK